MGKNILILDFDGTTSSHVPNPNEATFESGVLEFIKSFLEADSRNVLYFLTGRDPRYLQSLLPQDLRDHIEIFGNHGLSKIDDLGDLIVSPEAREYVDATSDLVAGLIAEIPDLKGHLEDKTLGVVLHLRWLQDVVSDRIVLGTHKFLSNNPELAGKFEAVSCDGVLELRPRLYHDKGTALYGLMEELGYDNVESLFYAGNDIPDIPAFTAVTKICSDHRIRGHNFVVVEKNSAIEHSHDYTSNKDITVADVVSLVDALGVHLLDKSQIRPGFEAITRSYLKSEQS